MKFKVGDRVIGQHGIGTVHEIDGLGPPYLVKFDNHVGIGFCLNGFGYWQFEKDLTLIPRRVTAIVIGEKGAAQFPFKHPDRTAAITEADRLAVKFPGQKFAVYELVSTRRANVSVGEV